MNKKLLRTAFALASILTITTGASAQDGDYQVSTCAKNGEFTAFGTLRVEDSSTEKDREQTQTVLNDLLARMSKNFDTLGPEEAKKANGMALFFAQSLLKGRIEPIGTLDFQPGCTLK